MKFTCLKADDIEVILPALPDHRCITPVNEKS